MFKSFRQGSSAKFNSNDNKLLEGERQKQKKRLSFKDPEVEKTPEPRGGIAGPSIASHSREKDYYFHGETQNFEDYYTEDQEQIDKQASRPTRDRSRSPDPRTRSLDQPKVVAKDCSQDTPVGGDLSFEDVKSKPSSSRQKQLLQSSKTADQDYLEVLSPPKPEAAAMKCPVIEFIGEEQEGEDPATSPVKNLGTAAANVEPLPTSARHQIQLLNYQLEQQRQQTQTAMYQIQLLKDQLEAESAARYKAQVHNHQLMLKNKELLDHIQNLFHQVQDLEKKIEKLENDAAVNHDSRPAQSYQDGYGRHQVSYRRNSGSTQSLWSAPSLLSPTYTTASYSRRGSATSLPPAQQASEAADISTSEQQADVSRKIVSSSSGKSDNSYKYSSPFVDVDWRAKRRGSSGNYNTLDYSRIKSSSSVVEATGTDRYLATTGTGATKNQASHQVSSSDSKQQQSSSSYVQRRSESVSGLDRAMSRKTITIEDSLMIGDPTNDFGGPSAQGGSERAVPGRSDTKSINCSDLANKSNKTSSAKKGLSSFSLKENQNKLAQSLETLRLFNS